MAGGGRCGLAARAAGAAVPSGTTGMSTDGGASPRCMGMDVPMGMKAPECVGTGTITGGRSAAAPGSGPIRLCAATYARSRTHRRT